MCGICGVIARGHAELNAVADAQVATMHHRGPDSHGTFRAPYGAISQNRLSIIDLVHGDPPITNEDGTSAVVLNGEIYNFKELRAGLVERGHRFGSEGDTEVIVHLSEELAPVELARALDGMFAFAVWDGSHERLIIGRDRLGKKPLYYAFDGGRLVFGSEIKAIFADTSVPRRLDPVAIPA
jgi:asparagine synthase (glutamine-hydrolysing)